jgi:hypothetical protein
MPNPLLDGCQRFSRLILPGARQSTIVEVLPELGIALEVNHDGCLFSLVINQELDALHVFSSGALIYCQV